MKAFVENKYVDALLKTLLAVVIVHVIAIGLAFFIGGTTGLFGMPVLWAHLTKGGIVGAIIVVVALIGVYYLFYRTSD